MSIQFAFTKEYEQQVVDSVLEHIEDLIKFILKAYKVSEAEAAEIATEFFIAGGSIVSTIIGTDVNDIDIYPKTVRAAKAIAEWADSSSTVTASNSGGR